MLEFKPRRLARNILLALHLTVYTFVLVVAILAVIAGGERILTLAPSIGLVLFWMPVIAAHLVIHNRIGAAEQGYQRGYGDAERSLSRVERDAYRAGFADAAQLLGTSDDPAMLERLALIEPEAEGDETRTARREKRKRRSLH